MPFWGSRRAYPAVSMTVAVLAALFLLSAAGRHAIPPPEISPQLAGEASPYMRHGSETRVKWRPLSREAFDEARRTDKPVLLLLGDEGSWAAHRYDLGAFRDPGVASVANARFVPIRIDRLQRPDWAQAILPLHRALVDPDSDVQLWVLTKRGGPVTGRGANWKLTAGEHLTWLDPRETPSPYGVLVFLLDSLALVDREESHARPAGALQSREDAVPAGVGVLEDAARPPFGASWPLVQWTHVPSPAQVDAALRSPQTNWLDGGLFGPSPVPGWVDFNQRLEVQAAWIQALVRAGYLDRARSEADALIRRFRGVDGWAAVLTAKATEEGRNPRWSFDLPELRRTLDRATLRRLGGQWSLDPRRNPLMIPYPSGPFDDESLSPLRRLRGEERPERAGVGYVDRTALAFVALGRLALAARDESLTREVLRLAALDLGPFRVGVSDLLRNARPELDAPATLADHVTFGEACLGLYALSGDETWLRSGEAVLRRGLELFASEPGLAVFARPVQEPEDELVGRTDLLDGLMPATTPWLADLCRRYGAVLRDGRLLARAEEMAYALAQVDGTGLRSVPGELRATLTATLLAVQSERLVVVRGPGAARRAAELRSQGQVALPGPGASGTDVCLGCAWTGPELGASAGS